MFIPASIKQASAQLSLTSYHLKHYPNLAEKLLRITLQSIHDEGPPQVALVVKNLPAKVGDKTPVWYLGWEDPLEEGMTTHSSILAWRIPLT